MGYRILFLGVKNVNGLEQIKSTDMKMFTIPNTVVEADGVVNGLAVGEVVGAEDGVVDGGVDGAADGGDASHTPMCLRLLRRKQKKPRV